MATLNPTLTEQPMPLNVIEMLRVSSDRQDVARQEDDAAENREQFELTVLRTIRIKISGTLVMGNAEVQAMLAQLSDPKVDGISVSAIDRIFRPKDFESMRILQFFFDNRKVIVSTKEGIVEPWTDRGWKLCMEAATQAGSELRELKRRTKGGRKKAQKQKRMTQTTPPYGMVYVDKYSKDAAGKCQYLREDTRPVEYAKGHEPIEGLTRRGVVEMVYAWRVAQKWRVGKIQTELNKRGILTAGKPGQFEPGAWSRQTVRQMLKRRKYAGEHIEGGEVMECPKFVELDTFDAAQRMFADAKEMSNGKPATKHELCGYLRCKACGRRHRTSTGKSGASYVCGNYDYKLRKQVCRSTPRVKCAVLEAVVWNAIWRLLTNPALLIANAAAYYDSLPSKNSTAKLEAELAVVKARIDRTRRMVKLGTEDEDKGNAEILADKQEVARIAAEIRAAGSVLALPAEHMVRAGCELLTALDSEPETFAERRPIYEALVDLKMTFDGEYVEIAGKVPVPEVAASGDRKCNRRFDEAYTSNLYIPIKIKERVA
jgi:DNA invertase Pin-like site-specific DNA recombinase